MITWEDTLNNFYYCETDGCLKWENDRHSNKVKNMKVGTIKTDFRKGKGLRKEVRVKFNNVTYCAARITWLYFNGELPDEIDHIDGNTLNNRIENLRSCSREENTKNMKVRSDSNTKVCGVGFSISKNKYCSRITDTSNGKRVHLGYFTELWDAICARKSADYNYGYHINHGRRY